MQTPDPVETSTLWLPGDLRVCSLSSWHPAYLPTQVPTSLLPSLPSHQKIHTQTNIIFSPFDVYFNRIHQFNMVVWESVFSWLAISKKADLWRQNSKLSYLFYSFIGCPACTSPGSLILGWLSLPSLLILPPSLTLPHLWYTFWLWFSFLRAEEQRKHFGFLVFFTFFDWVHMIRFSCSRFPLEVFWTSWSYSVTWKTREGYYIWENGITSELERRFHEKGCGLMRAFVAGKGNVKDLGSKSMEKVGSIDGIILPSHCLCISVDKGSSSVLSPLKYTALELFLAAVAS